MSKINWEVGQTVKVKGTKTHDGIGTIELINETHGRNGPTYVVKFSEKEIERITNALKQSKTDPNPTPTTITRKTKIIPRAAVVFGNQLEKP